jgi:hypothetical protein
MELTNNPNGDLSYKERDVKKKSGPKPAYIHTCSEREQLERMRLILVGNGDPKTGLAYLVEASNKSISDIKTDISEIKLQLKETIIAASTAASSIEKYKLEVKSFEAGKDDAEEKAIIAENLEAQRRRDRWQRWFWVIMACLTVTSIWVGIWINNKDNIKTDGKIDNLGVPVQVNTRNGEFVNIPNVEIKFWPKDFTGDTIKEIK